MKKIIFWIFSFFLIALLGLWLWCQRPGLPVEGVLPSHPLVFVRLAHLEDHINQVVRSDFGKNLANIDVTDVLARNNFSVKDINDIKHWQKDLVKCWSNPFIKRLLSKEASAAIYRNGSSYQVYIVIRLTVSMRIAELLGQLFHQWGDDVTVKPQQYQGWGINHLSLKKQHVELSYVRIRDLIIMTPDAMGHLEDVIDVYAHKHGSLQGDDSFDFVRKNAYSSGEGLAYINLNLLGFQTRALGVFGLSYMPGVVSKYKIMVGFDKNDFPVRMRKIFDCPAAANDSLKLVPVNAILYNWGICYDLDQSWAVVKQKLQGRPELAHGINQFKHRLERHFHVNIRRDVLPVLGHEIGGYLTDVDMQGPYPFPRLLIFIKILDRKAAQALLDKLTEYPVTTMYSEDYQHVNIHYISLTLGANMDPGYGFLGDYLLVATSRQLLKRSIDAYNDSLRSIISDDAVEQFSLAKGEKFHSMTLMKTSELSRRAQDFLGWVDKYLSGQVSMAAAYKQDGNNKQQELDQAIADKSTELLLAKSKLTQLKGSSLSENSLDGPVLLNGEIENLSREEEAIREDIANYIEQKADLVRLLDNYALGARSDKLTMYNMDNLVSPVLKSLETIDAQAVTVRFSDKILETEFLVK